MFGISAKYKLRVVVVARTNVLSAFDIVLAPIHASQYLRMYKFMFDSDKLEQIRI